MSERDSAESRIAVVADPCVFGKLLASPEDHGEPTSLEEDRLVDLLSLPSQLLIKPERRTNVRHSECYQADALIHHTTVTPCYLMGTAPRPA